MKGGIISLLVSSCLVAAYAQTSQNTAGLEHIKLDKGWRFILGHHYNATSKNLQQASVTVIAK